MTTWCQNVMCLIPAVVCVELHSGFECLLCVMGTDFIADKIRSSFIVGG